MDKNQKMRISRYLASCGVASRRKCEEYVLSGKIEINGKIISELSHMVDPADMVELDGRLLEHRDKKTIMLNKPPGYLSTVKDDFKRKTVMSLINDKDTRLYPVGRLDYNSRGMIILTNDGELSYRVTHPKFGVPKTYEVRINNKLLEKDVKKIKKGIEIEGRELIPLNITILESGECSTVIKIKIVEGRKRIIRKIFKKIGYNVTDLKRTMIGKLGLNGLSEGKSRILKRDDINALMTGFKSIK